MFKDNSVDLGTVKVRSVNKVVFKADPSISDVEIVPPSCDCTSPEWDEVEKEVRVTYVPKPISKELVKHGNTSYNSSRDIAVRFVYEGIQRTQFLTIKAHVVI